MLFGPTYDLDDATYIVKAGSTVKDFATLDQPGVKVAAVNNTTTMIRTSAGSPRSSRTGMAFTVVPIEGPRAVSTLWPVARSNSGTSTS